MASITGRKVRWYDPVTGKQRAKTLSSEKDAKRFADRCENEARLYGDGYLDADQLRQAQVRVVPIATFAKAFSEELDKRQLSDGHRRNVKLNLGRALAGAGIQTVRDLTPQRVDRYLGQIVRDGRAAATHNHYRGALLAFCSWLVAFGHLDRNPVDAVKPLRASRDRRFISRALSLAEVGALLRATTSDSDASRSVRANRRTLYLFRVRTGLRICEANRVRWSDIDLRTKTLTLRSDVTKNAKADVLPLADDLCGALAELQADALKAGHGLGARPFPLTPAPRTWYCDLERAGIKAETDDGHADRKCLRKTFDSFLLRADVDLLDVMLLMRHSPPGGMSLTLGTYGDEAALLTRKRRALARMVAWIETQQTATAVVSG